MQKYILFLLVSFSFTSWSKPKPQPADILQKFQEAKAYFQQKWPDVGQVISSPDRTRPSNIWTRAVYYEGLMELYKIDPKA